LERCGSAHRELPSSDLFLYHSLLVHLLQSAEAFF
jgi:hypothetical protein